MKELTIGGGKSVFLGRHFITDLRNPPSLNLWWHDPLLSHSRSAQRRPGVLGGYPGPNQLSYITSENPDRKGLEDGQPFENDKKHGTEGTVVCFVSKQHWWQNNTVEKQTSRPYLQMETVYCKENFLSLLNPSWHSISKHICIWSQRDIWPIQTTSKLTVYHLESRWRNSHVLVYHGH